MRETFIFLAFFVCITLFVYVNVYADEKTIDKDSLGAVSVDPIVRDDLYPITPILIAPQLTPIKFGPYDYFIWHDHGGWWCDSEKKAGNTDDDLMCWAAACSNCLEYAGWGPVTDLVNGELTDTDEIFYTDIACRLLDMEKCRCTGYKSRAKEVAECLVHLADKHEAFRWLPASCA